MQEKKTVAVKNKKPCMERFKLALRRNWQLYLIMAVPFIWLIVFRYIPMVGVQIAFRNYRAADGIFGSQWVGLEYFKKFFDSYLFTDVMKNTIILSVYNLIANFPLPIIFALALNNTRRKKLKKTTQMIAYMPHFISLVVMVGIVIQFLNKRVGIINMGIATLGGQPQDFMANASAFKHIYVWSDVWQNLGWNSIIYIAALSGIDQDLHEAAQIDGANRFQRMFHIDIPGIVPTIVMLLIMNTGYMMSLGFEKAFLMQNDLNRGASEILSTFVYKMGLASSFPDFSYGAAIGLFNSVINLVIILVVNKIAKKFAGISLW
ncbi:MAG: ABC transporter permease [Marvinbryantia sp.]|jgi:putative aldouronate transport system permease protein